MRGHRRPIDACTGITRSGKVGHVRDAEVRIEAARPATFGRAEALRHDAGAHLIGELHRRVETRYRAVRGFDEDDARIRRRGVRPLHIQGYLDRPARVVGRSIRRHRTARAAVDDRERAPGGGRGGERQTCRRRNGRQRAARQAELRVEARELRHDIRIVLRIDQVDGLTGAPLGGLGGGDAGPAARERGQPIGGANLRRRIGRDLGCSSHGFCRAIGPRAVGRDAVVADLLEHLGSQAPGGELHEGRVHRHAPWRLRRGTRRLATITVIGFIENHGRQVKGWLRDACGGRVSGRERHGIALRGGRRLCRGTRTGAGASASA